MKTNDKNKDAFLEVYDAHSDGLFRYALYKTSNRELALDLTQDSFTKVWEYLQDGKDIDNLKAFLYRTLSNMIIDSYRKKKSESLDKLMEDGFDHGHDERGDFEDALMGESLWRHVNTLEDKYKEVITLRYMNDLSIKEIAQTLNESENNISVRIHRALDKIKQLTK